MGNEEDIQWIPYMEQEQGQLSSAWNNGMDHVFLKDNRYKVEFKRNPTYPRPSGYQFVCDQLKPWKRAVVYGTRDGDGLLGGVPCASDGLPGK